MRTFPYSLVKETWEEQRAAGRHNPATVLVYRRRRFTLAAGDSDDINAFIHGKGSSATMYVVSTNNRLGYVGLQVFNLTGEETNSLFFQNEEDITDVLGKRGLDYTPRTIAKILGNYCY